MLLEIELFKKAGFNSDKLARWFSLTGLGAYSALFLKGRCTIAASMNRLLKEFQCALTAANLLELGKPKRQGSSLYTS
jgi:hypothetical protein